MPAFKARLSLGTSPYIITAASVCSLLLTIGVARFSYTSIMPSMVRQGAVSEYFGAWLATFNYAGYMCGAIYCVLQKNRTQRHWMYLALLFIAVFSTALMALTQNLVAWAILRYLAGFSGIAGSILASGMLIAWQKAHGRREELGIHFIGLGGGVLMSGVVATLVSGLSWQAQWLGFSVVAAFLLLPALLLPMPPLASTSTGTPKRLSLSRWYLMMSFAYFCAGWGFAISATFTIASVERLPLLAGWGSWIWTAAGVLALPSGFLWDLIARRIGNNRALTIAYALQALSFLLPYAFCELTNVFAALLFGVTFVGIVCLTLADVGRRIPHNPSGAMAGLTICYGIAQIAAPSLSAYYLTSGGGYAQMYLVALIVMGAGVALLGLMHKVR